MKSPLPEPVSVNPGSSDSANATVRQPSPQATAGIFEYVELACPCCDANAFRTVGYRGGRAHRFGQGECVRVVKCERCTHIYPRPMPVLRNPADAYNNPDEYFKYHDGDVKIARYKLLLNDIARHAGKSAGRIIDIGCGRGELLCAARQLGLRATGVETSVEFAQCARSRYGVEVDNCSLEEAGYASGSFDIAILGAVIEHLYKPRDTLNEIWRVLRPGGILWLDAPNECSLFSRVANLYLLTKGRDWTCHLSPTFPPYHVQGFGPRSLVYLLKSTGFQLIDLRIFPSATLRGAQTTALVRLEFHAQRMVRAIERTIGTGSYMEALASKSET
jgi:SAM-dependent methyltransferase